MRQRDVIKVLFQTFYQRFSYLELEQMVEYFSILGGLDEAIELDYFDDIFSMLESQFVQNFAKYEAYISPSYILESPYKELLMAIARGDGKYYSVLRKAKLSESVGDTMIETLVSLNILTIEYSRESPLRVHPKHKLKKEQRSYRIQDKLRFRHPFMRFWFGFVSYYTEELRLGKGENFLQHFKEHYERLRSLVYEQLSNALLLHYYEDKEVILSSGSYWDIHSEFDILAITKSKKMILGECKYKERIVCKNELNKLQLKAIKSGIAVDSYALFSKSGFSKELWGMQDAGLLLFDLAALKKLL